MTPQVGAASAHALLLTAPGPGAIAIIALSGAVEAPLATLTGSADWPVGAARLTDLAGIDRGVVCRLGATAVEIMPHGGPRVVQRILETLAAAGAPVADPASFPSEARYPEADSESEAQRLALLARARSPLAVDLLAREPDAPALAAEPGDAELGRRLWRLIDPPIVVLAGPPNVGKSTLSNALVGRPVSLAQDAPGTTRDYTRGLANLAGLVVAWHDTPGLGDAADAVDADAAALADRLFRRADYLIAATDGTHVWPDLPRTPDLRLATRSDHAPRTDAALNVSARTGAGLVDLAERIRDDLVPPADRASPRAWPALLCIDRAGRAVVR